MAHEMKVVQLDNLGDFVEAFNGCGVWNTGPPPKRESMTLREYVKENMEWRDAGRKDKSDQCACTGCPLNTSDFDGVHSLMFNLCDFMLLLAGRVENHPLREVSTKKGIEEFVEIHQSCERIHMKSDPECMKCPLNQDVKKVTPFGSNVAVLNICQLFEKIQPRKDLLSVDARPVGVLEDHTWTNQSESRFE